MQLALAFPEGWEVRGGENGRRVVSVPPVPASGVPDLTVEIDTLVPAPDEPRAWIAAALGRDIPPGASVEMLGSQTGQTRVGWPMELVHARVVDASGATVELRLGGFYKMNEWGAHALVRATDASRFDVQRAELTHILLGGRPEWRSRELVACIADLWS